MAKDRTIGVILRDDHIEWAALSPGSRGGEFAVESGRSPLISPAGAEPAESGTAPAESGAAAESPPAAPSRAERAAAATLPVKGRATIGVESARLLLRVVRLPNAEKDELDGMVELQADKFSPFPAESQTCSYEILDRGANDQRVLIAAVRQDVVNALRDDLGGCGLSSVRVDAEAMGFWRLLRCKGHVPSSGRRAFVLLDRPSADLIVVDDGTPTAFRSLVWDAGVAPADWARELASELDYTLMSVEMEFGPKETEGISLWCGDEDRDAVADGLRRACSRDVEAHALSALGTAAEGIALRTVDQGDSLLDLTPVSWRRAEESSQFKRRLWGAAGIVFAAWAVLAGSFAGALTYQRNAARGLESERDRWGREAMEVREMRQRVFAIERYTNQTYSVLECLRDISERQTPGVDLSAFAYRKGVDIKISGAAETVNQVYDFKSQLDASTLFKKTELQGPRWDERRRRQVFDVTIQLPEGG